MLKRHNKIEESYDRTLTALDEHDTKFQSVLTD